MCTKVDVGRRNVYPPCFGCTSCVSSLCVGAVEGSVDQLAFDLMLPVATLKEYVEMVRRCLCGCGCGCVNVGVGVFMWGVGVVGICGCCCVCVVVGMWMCRYEWVSECVGVWVGVWVGVELCHCTPQVEENKTVMLYGPQGSGTTFLAKSLADFIKVC